MFFRKKRTEKKLLYIDSEENETFIMLNLLKDKFKVIQEHKEDKVLALLANREQKFEIIMVDIDTKRYLNAIQEMIKMNEPSPYVVLVSRNLDDRQLYQLIEAYGADDYIKKPFTKQKVEWMLQGLNQVTKNIFKDRLRQDYVIFNQYIQWVNQKLALELPEFSLATLDAQVAHLNRLKLKVEPFGILSDKLNTRILIVEDEKNIRYMYQKFLNNKPYQVFSAETPDEAIKILQSQTIDIIVLDLGLPCGGSGLDIIQWVYRSHYKQLCLPDIIVISSYYDKETVMKAIRCGAKMFINKPMTVQRFITAIEQVIDIRYMRTQLDQAILVR